MIHLAPYAASPLYNIGQAFNGIVLCEVGLCLYAGELASRILPFGFQGMENISGLDLIGKPLVR
ncbi:hypothetical protein PL75_11015, partial [Neisseria arctica]